jgi:hypothetical protein
MRSFLKATVASVAEDSADPRSNAHPAIIANDKQAVILAFIALLFIFDSMSFEIYLNPCLRFYVAARIRGSF